MWLGVACPFIGVFVWMGQTMAGRVTSFWFALALTVLGVILIGYSLSLRRSIWRYVALAFVVLIAGGQTWFLFGPARLPAYAGPLEKDKEFPEFKASLADGKEFTQEDLKKGDRDTALVFFRGHW
jgi:hypothetical protein